MPRRTVFLIMMRLGDKARGPEANGVASMPSGPFVSAGRNWLGAQTVVCPFARCLRAGGRPIGTHLILPIVCGAFSQTAALMPFFSCYLVLGAKFAYRFAGLPCRPLPCPG